MSLLDVIKRASVDAIEAANPVAVLFGVVTKTAPLEINVEQRFTLTEEFLVFTERIRRYQVNIEHTHPSGIGIGPAPEQRVVVRHGLSVGDKVVLLRVQGGQKYVVLDKIVDSLDTVEFVFG